MNRAGPPPADVESVRPLWAEVDLGAIEENLDRVRERAGQGSKLIAPVKADAYGLGVVEVGLHLERLGVEGLATANVAEAIALRDAGARLPILIYGAPLPDGIEILQRYGLTPTVYDDAGVAAAARVGARTGRTLAVHMKVDAGFGRLGVRLDTARALAGRIAAEPSLDLEGIYTHLPFSAAADAAWAARRLAAFAAVVREIEDDRGAPVAYVQAAASSALSMALEAPFNTVSPGHLLFGLSPIAGREPTAMGYRPALAAVRARLIHVGEQRRGEEIAGAYAAGLAADRRVGVILFGMANGFTPPAEGQTIEVLICGQRCAVLGVTAEYATIDLTDSAAAVGEPVTVVGSEGDDAITAEEVAAKLGAPSAAYWQVALRNIPRRYRA